MLPDAPSLRTLGLSYADIGQRGAELIVAAVPQVWAWAWVWVWVWVWAWGKEPEHSLKSWSATSRVAPNRAPQLVCRSRR